MLRKTLLILTAALGLTMSAHARLGWTLDQCRDQWGTPIEHYDSVHDKTFYNFRVQENLWAQVYTLNNYVHSVNYCSKDRTFLLKNVNQLLQKNYAISPWLVYDDGRGKATIRSWQAFGQNGQVAVYAILWAAQDDQGFYRLQVSTSSWGEFCAGFEQQHPNQVNSSSDGLNI